MNHGVVIEEDSDIMGRLTVDASQVTTLDMELAHASLQINNARTDQIWVGTDEDAENISVTCKGEKIVIQDNRTGDKRRKDINIYMEIPYAMRFSDVNIQVDAGYVEISESLQADKMVLNAGAGEIDVDQLETGDFSVSVGAGQVYIGEGVFLGNVKMDCGVGEINMYGAQMEADADISCGMGAIEIELKGSTKKANYVLNCGLGSIEIDDKSYTALGREKRIDNNAEHTFKMNCGLGSISMWS